MDKSPCIAKEQFWKRVDQVNARELVTSITNAVKEQVGYSRALNTARRTTILLGRGTAKEFQFKAEMHYRKRNSQLRYTKHWLAKLVESIDEKREKHFAEFLSRGGFKEFTAYARQTTILRMLNSEVPPEDARKAVKQLDSTLEKIEGLKSLKEIHNYTQRHLDELIGKKMGNPNPDGWCLLLLIFSSIFAILVVIAALICAFTFGFACEDILDQMIDQACG